MTFKFLIAVFFVALPFSGMGQNLLSGPIVDPANGYSYYLLNTASWTDSQAEAVALGGNLATVENQTENNWILSTFGFFGGLNRFLWIGLNDVATPGNFVWASGQTSTFTNWAAGEPNDNGGNEVAVEMYGPNTPRGVGYPPVTAGTWNDVPDVSNPYGGNDSGSSYGPVYGVVEVVPEPSAITLGVFAVGFLFLPLKARIS